MLADAKVAKLHTTVDSQKYVVKFYVSVEDSLLVAIVDRVHNLFEYAFGNVFLKLAALSHIREQVTARHQLHYKKDVLLSLEILVEPHDVLVAGLLQNHYFLKHLLAL